jgi:hypothetical protein
MIVRRASCSGFIFFKLQGVEIARASAATELQQSLCMQGLRIRRLSRSGEFRIAAPKMRSRPRELLQSQRRGRVLSAQSESLGWLRDCESSQSTSTPLTSLVH